jgi:hypothetical protein
MNELRMASIWALPEPKPTIISLPGMSSSCAAFTTPIAEPSFAPKKPLMSGMVWIIAFARSSDFSGSPPRTADR